MRLSSTFVWSAAALVLLGLTLSACDTTTGSPPVFRGEPDDGTVSTEEICPRDYKPVCAEQGNRRQTFDNECEARKAGWEPAANGTCEKPHS